MAASQASYCRRSSAMRCSLMAPFGVDAVVLFLVAGAFAARHHRPRPWPGSVVSLRMVASPVGVANIGKNRAPPGLVV